MKEALKDYFFWICMGGIVFVVVGIVCIGINGGK
jgi:hypothetical protein